MGIIYIVSYLIIGVIKVISDASKPPGFRPPYVRHSLGWLFGILLWPLTVFITGKFWVLLVGFYFFFTQNILLVESNDLGI
jgi:hypothetical protein